MVAASTFDIWLAPLDVVAGEGDPGTLVLSAPPEIRSWVADRFAGVLRKAARAALGADVEVRVLSQADTAGSAATGAGASPAAGSTAPAAVVVAPPAPAELNPKLTFQQFVIGRTNHLAHAAALAVAELPAQAYNPLFIYGPPGVGKTHLLQAIGNYVQDHGAGLTVRATTAERFTNEFVAALQSRSPAAIDAFKAGYRRADVVLVDDIQFLAAKVKTEQEFFHTFNALLELGSQLVLTCDRLPRDLAALEDRLRERFEAGLVTEIAPPDRCTRLAVLRKRADQDAIVIADPAALDVIADRMTANIRSLEGALIRVVAYASLSGRALDAALATEVLDGLYGRAPAPGTARPRPAPGLDDVTRAVCESFAMTPEELISPSRAVRTAWARQVAMYLAREHTGRTLPAIGAHFGGRGHTTVMHAVKRTVQRMADDPEARATVHALSTRLLHGDDDRHP